MDLPMDRISLARAFDLAWGIYEQRGKSPLPDDTARINLAKFLVTLAREGAIEETALATAGVQHLVSLEPPGDEPKTEAKALVWSMRFDDARGSMIDYWRITFVPIEGF